MQFFPAINRYTTRYEDKSLDHNLPAINRSHTIYGDYRRKRLKFICFADSLTD
jgi:hypothetical protein